VVCGDPVGLAKIGLLGTALARLGLIGGRVEGTEGGRLVVEEFDDMLVFSLLGDVVTEEGLFARGEGILGISLDLILFPAPGDISSCSPIAFNLSRSLKANSSEDSAEIVGVDGAEADVGLVESSITPPWAIM